MCADQNADQNADQDTPRHIKEVAFTVYHGLKKIDVPSLKDKKIKDFTGFSFFDRQYLPIFNYIIHVVQMYISLLYIYNRNHNYNYKKRNNH